MSSRAAALAGLLLTAPLATAQTTASTTERATVWVGLGLETVVPSGSLGVSAPVGRIGTLTVAPRLGVDGLLLVGPVVSADLLFSGADVGVYGGPSAGLFLAGQGGWRVPQPHAPGSGLLRGGRHAVHGGAGRLHRFRGAPAGAGAHAAP
ncbi:hypothetical protein [Deinococcus soli (ex Cha et al. 2016)]|uniref:hypothetical protein n=1 Tax=Deinococcus soli (ex Cha et al. 2016) TaxID=1309411 RepID=UPI001665C880|nr:hypothetical protein [Deinococcus soli (ex Cha et al. 2016)]